MSLNKLLTKKFDKGYCQPPSKTKKVEGPPLENEITLENFDPANCSDKYTPSKGGYVRKQLFDFGVNYLKIPYNQLIKEGTKNEHIYLSKGDLCNIINKKYREIKTRGNIITDKMRVEAYGKDINNCNNGESKGGYSLHDLQEIAINYFDINEKDNANQETPLQIAMKNATKQSY
jgi:hypothetical protein